MRPAGPVDPRGEQAAAPGVLWAPSGSPGLDAPGRDARLDSGAAREDDARMPRGTGRLAHAVAASAPWLLLGSAGALAVADMERWGDVCGWSDRHDAPCVGRQSDVYDYLPAFAPWEPVGADGAWGALALGLLAAGLLGACLVIGPTRRKRLEAVAGVALLVTVAGLAALTAASAVLGRGADAGSARWTVLLSVAFPFWALAAPLILAGLAFARVVAEPEQALPPGSGAANLAAVLLVGTTPLGSPLVAGVVVGFSYDTSPWSGVVVAVLLVGAAAALLRVRRLERRAAGGGEAGRAAAQNEASEPSARA